VLYVLDKDISFVGVLAFAFVIYAVFPMGMLSLLIILSKVIIDYFTGKQDDISIFALGMCFFFVIMIFFSLIGYMNMLFGKKLNLKKSNDTSRIKKILKFK
jgi:ABC-type multidrug transport system fused ATPase/permease subunit